jgi:hypothetical protein
MNQLNQLFAFLWPTMILENIYQAKNAGHRPTKIVRIAYEYCNNSWLNQSFVRSLEHEKTTLFSMNLRPRGFHPIGSTKFLQNHVVYLSKIKPNMKTSILICLVILVSGLANAQKLKEAEVPEVVKKAFNEKFKNVKEVKWSKESPTEFEAEFEAGKQEQSANFDNTGKWLVTETEIKTAELPQAVHASIAKEFAGYKIEEAEKAETSDKGSFYEVELKNGKVKYEVQLSADGKVLKKEEMKEKKKEKEEKKD